MAEGEPHPPAPEPAGGAPGAGASTETAQLLLNMLVLQREAVRAHVGTFHRQVEAFVQQTRRHPLTFAPCAARHEEPVELPAPADAATSVASGLALSKALAKLMREHCDEHACLRSREHMRDFVTAAREQLKVPDDRYAAVYVVDRTLQRSRAAAEAAGVAPGATTQGVEGLHKSFEQDHGFELLADWFTDACSYQDDPRRKIATMILKAMERNRPVVAFTRKLCVKRLRPLLSSTVLTNRAVRKRCSELIELMRDP